MAGSSVGAASLGLNLQRDPMNHVGLFRGLLKLENAILTTPSKALEIPLLQRDLENTKISQQAMISAVKDGVDRVYDLNK